MPIPKIPHYSLENPATVYDEESLTALQLAARTAAKVNEAVEVVNEANKYMRENLPEFVEAKILEMEDNGDLDSVVLRAVASKKVDKGGVGQVSYSMLAQDAREAMTGGNVAVVGVNAVLPENIVDGAVTEAKLSAANKTVIYHASNMDTPVLILNPDTKSGEINPALTENIKLYTGDKYWSINPDDVSVDVSEWDGSYYGKLFFSPSAKLVKVTAFSKSGVNVGGDYLCLGRLGWTITDNVIPVQIGDRVFCANSQVRLMDAPKPLKPVRIAMDRYRHPNNAVFNVDTVNGNVSIVKGGSYSYFSMNESASVTFAADNLDYSTVNFTKGAMYMWVDSVSGKIHFIQSIVDVPRWWHFFGVVYMDFPYMSTCVVPFTVNGKHYYHPNRNRREWANIVYTPYSFETRTLPYVDFVKKKLVFPSVTRLFLANNEMNMAIMTSEGDSYEVPFEPTDGAYQYLVGSNTGLKFITYDEFIDFNSATECDGLFYLGHCNQTTKTVRFTFDCLRGRTLSVLGDSISTYEGYIPEGNSFTYKNDGTSNVNMTWWKRAMNRCGLSLNTNNSNSGSRVTNTRTDDKPYGVEMVKHLSNGNSPDVIVIYMGINDYQAGVALGTYDGKGAIPADQTNFRAGYAQMLYNALTTYPTARVFACTLPPIEKTTDEKVAPDMNKNGVYLSEYNNAIREICRAFCVDVIELSGCGLHYYNGKEFMYDYNQTTGAFVHPNAKGHRLISQKVIPALLETVE